MPEFKELWRVYKTQCSKYEFIDIATNMSMDISSLFQFYVQDCLAIADMELHVLNLRFGTKNELKVRFFTLFVII